MHNYHNGDNKKNVSLGGWTLHISFGQGAGKAALGGLLQMPTFTTLKLQVIPGSETEPFFAKQEKDDCVMLGFVVKMSLKYLKIKYKQQILEGVCTDKCAYAMKNCLQRIICSRSPS